MVLFITNILTKLPSSWWLIVTNFHPTSYLKNDCFKPKRSTSWLVKRKIWLFIEPIRKGLTKMSQMHGPLPKPYHSWLMKLVWLCMISTNQKLEGRQCSGILKAFDSKLISTTYFIYLFIYFLFLSYSIIGIPIL